MQGVICFKVCKHCLIKCVVAFLIYSVSMFEICVAIMSTVYSTYFYDKMLIGQKQG